MTLVGQPERAARDRVVALFRDGYLGDWADREGRRDVEEALLTEWRAAGT